MNNLEISEDEQMRIAMAMSIEERQKPAKDATLVSEKDQMSIAIANSLTTFERDKTNSYEDECCNMCGENLTQRELKLRSALHRQKQKFGTLKPKKPGSDGARYESALEKAIANSLLETEKIVDEKAVASTPDSQFFYITVSGGRQHITVRVSNETTLKELKTKLKGKFVILKNIDILLVINDTPMIEGDDKTLSHYNVLCNSTISCYCNFLDIY